MRSLRFRDLPARSKLLIAFLCISATTAGVGALGYTRLQRINQDLRSLYQRNLLGALALEEADASLVRMALQARVAAQLADPLARDSAARKLDEQDQTFRSRLTDYLAVVDEKDREDGLVVQEAEDEYGRRARAMLACGAGCTTLERLTDVTAAQRALVSRNLGQLIEKERKQAQRAFEENDAQVRSSGAAIAALSGLAVALGLLLGWLLSRSLVPPLVRAVAALGRVAAGDLTPRLRLGRDDEIGKLGGALDRALDKIAAVLGRVAVQAETLAQASSELSAASHQMGAEAEETSAQAGVVSSGADEVSGSVQAVAAASEELGSTIQEIARRTGAVAEVARESDGLARGADRKAAALGKHSEAIGEVIKVIAGIAEQTSLLALNATIEAARAGTSGKGFAVVASEVKELARECAKAADEVSRRVQDVQSGAGEVVGAIGAISQSIGRITGLSTETAAAVEQQAASTAEIARSVAAAASGAAGIASNISGVAATAASTAQGASRTQESARLLAEMSAELHSLVSGFQLREAAPGAAAGGERPAPEPAVDQEPEPQAGPRAELQPA